MSLNKLITDTVLNKLSDNFYKKKLSDFISLVEQQLIDISKKTKFPIYFFGGNEAIRLVAVTLFLKEIIEKQQLSNSFFIKHWLFSRSSPFKDFNKENIDIINNTNSKNVRILVLKEYIKDCQNIGIVYDMLIARLVYLITDPNDTSYYKYTSLEKLISTAVCYYYHIK